MIVTDEKIEANRRNAAQSTGPVSAEGKSRSASNSTKAGWFARELEVRPEDAETYAAFRQSWLDSIQPEGNLENEQFENYVRSTWHIREIIEHQNFVTESSDPLAFLDTNAQPQLDRLHRYEAQFERRAQRCLAEIRRLQTARAQARILAPPAAGLSAPAPAPAPPLADPARIAAAKRTQISISRANAITPEIYRDLAILKANTEHLSARSRASEAGVPPPESGE